jgi:hypothetical protein
MSFNKEGKKIPLNKETAEAMQKMLANSHILQKYIFPHARDGSEYDLIKQMVELMEKANLDKHYIYAYIKTRGIMLTRENQKYVSQADKRDWRQATLQYDHLIKSGALNSEDSLIPFINASKKFLIPKKLTQN